MAVYEAVESADWLIDQLFRSLIGMLDLAVHGQTLKSILTCAK
jgi:hypothetical protein